MANRFPIEIHIERPDDSDVRDPGEVWKVSFTKRYGEKSSLSNVEFLSQGELIDLWQQIGQLFHLAGM